ncbi:mannitol 1-phosphate dehydrogenase [Botrytis cinerea]
MKLLHPAFWENYKAIANWGDDDVWWDFVVGDRVGDSQGRYAERWEGKRIAQVRMKEGREGQSTAHRRSLMDILIKLLPSSCDVRFGKRLVGIVSSVSDLCCGSHHPHANVTLQFQDGTTSIADLVIGADGVKSLCRDIVLAPSFNAEAFKARFTGKIAYRGLIPMEEAKARIGEKAGQRIFYLGHGGHVVSFPVEGGKSMNIVAFANREEGSWEGSWVKENVGEELERDYLDGRWGEMSRGLWGSIIHFLSGISSDERTTDTPFAAHQIALLLGNILPPPAPTFHHPTLPILLIGDSAHTTAPHFGQGAGLGIEDVYILTKLLSQLPTTSHSSVASSNLRALFTAYTQIRQPRATTAVSSANYYGRMLDMEDPVISDNLSLIEEKVRGIAETIWGYDEIREGKGQ